MRRPFQLIIFFLVTAALILAAVPATAHSQPRLLVNARFVATSPAPEIHSDLLLAPVQDLGPALGARVIWREWDQRVEITKGSAVILVTPGRQTARVNGAPVWLPAAPEPRAGTTMVPARWLAEELGVTVVWNPAERVAAFVTPEVFRYKAQGGDRLSYLADRYDARLEVLRLANGLTGDLLRAGQVVAIPLADPLADPRNRFPVAGPHRPLRDDYGEGRDWNLEGGDNRRHEGIDILADKGVPVVSATYGTIAKLGWNDYGGWRVTIAVPGSDYQVYYAHLSGYAPGLKLGQEVAPGDPLGYVGNTGYGPEGTAGLFISHLHFGVYRNGKAINPFRHLVRWAAGG